MLYSFIVFLKYVSLLLNITKWFFYQANFRILSVYVKYTEFILHHSTEIKPEPASRLEQIKHNTSYFYDNF